MVSITAFLQLQIDRILSKGPIHSSGPKKPTLSQIDLNKKPLQGK